MFKCDLCDKNFETTRGLSGHTRVHGPSKGTYSISRKTGRNIESFTCIECGKNGEYYPSAQTGKFCSRDCQSVYNWKTIVVPSILLGECSNKGALKSYLKQTKGEQCEICSQPPIWQGKPLTLQLDHIDGNSDNNQLTNLRILCPHCHTQTPTYGSKNNRKGEVKDTKRNSYLRSYQSGAIKKD